MKCRRMYPRAAVIADSNSPLIASSTSVKSTVTPLTRGPTDEPMNLRDGLLSEVAGHTTSHTLLKSKPVMLL